MPRREEDAIRSLQRWAAGFLPEPWEVVRVVEKGKEPVRPYALVEFVGSTDTDGAPFMQDVTAAFTVNLYLPRAATRAAGDEAALALRERVWQAVKVGPDPRRPTTDRIPLYSYEPRNEIQRLRVRGATGGTWRVVQDGNATSAIAWNADAAAVHAALEEVLPEMTSVAKRGGGVFDVMFVGELAGVDVEPLEIDAAELVTAVEPTVTVILEGAPAPWRAPPDYLAVSSFGQTTLRDQDDPALVMVAVDLRCAFTRGPVRPWDAMLLQSVTVGNGG